MWVLEFDMKHLKKAKVFLHFSLLVFFHLSLSLSFSFCLSLYFLLIFQCFSFFQSFYTSLSLFNLSILVFLLVYLCFSLNLSILLFFLFLFLSLSPSFISLSLSSFGADTLIFVGLCSKLRHKGNMFFLATQSDS